MAWAKSSDQLIKIFYNSLPSDPRVEQRKMFGYPCAFARGNMFTGLFQEEMYVRLPDKDRAALLAVPGSHILEPMPGRPMREYAVLPADMLTNPETVRSWVSKSLAYAAKLPAKTSKTAPKAKPAAKKKKSAPPKKAPKRAAKKSAKKAAVKKKSAKKRSGKK